MDTLSRNNLPRGYMSILLEEIALEGLDGITLEVLWLRLKNNLEWSLNPIDNNIQEFIWKKLIALKDVRWYNLKQPRKTPQIFTCFEDFYAALEKESIQAVSFSSSCYPHFLVRDGDIVGSCPAYHERIDVTDEIHKLSLSEANERYPNQLVIVANQEVRNHFLLSGNVNPELDIPDISYCILERIGRARGCGELSSGMHFLKNGPNPTFYFWNRLKKMGLITAQLLNLSHKLTNTTLFYLPKFYKNYTNDVANAVYTAVNMIKSSPNQFLPLLDVKAVFPNEKRKAMKSDLFRRFMKTETIPFKECFPNSSDSECQTKSGGIKVVRVVKLIDKNVDPEVIFRPAEPDEETEKRTGILKGTRLFNRPLITQCYKVILDKGAEGMSMAEVGAALGLNKLLTRLMMKSLKKIDLVSSLSFDNGRQRYYRYYSKKYDEQVKENLKQQIGNALSVDKENFTGNCSIFDDTSAQNDTGKLNENEGKKDNTNIVEDSCVMDTSDDISLKRKNTESDDTTKFSKKQKIDSPDASDSTKDKSGKCFKAKISAGENVCFLRRTNIILEYLYKHQVTTKPDLLKVIKEEELKLGVSKGTPCSKSVKRIIHTLNLKNKLKEIKKVIVEERLNKTREVVFICAPAVTEDHPIIQNTTTNIRKNLSIIHLKSSVVSSEKKLQEMKSKFAKLSRSKENDLKYGIAPKFGRMRILHEFVIQLIYHYDGDEDMNRDESIKYVKSFCSDFDDNEEIPKMYFKEISSRMFVPPLTKYEEYSEGWISLNDLVERLPLRMLFSLVRFSYCVPGIDLYLKHPVKQFYLLRHLPYEIQQVLTADKKYISSISMDIRNLCLIGLAQLGPKMNSRGSTNLIFMNKRTELLDTRPCPPTYFQINPNLSYTKYYYEFASSNGTETYWNDALKFCVGTRLCRKQTAKRLSARNRKLKPELLSCLEVREINEASNYDTGELPGDGLGAAGYDSTLYSHFIKQWFQKSNEKVVPATNITKTSAIQLRQKSNTQLKRMRITFKKSKSKKARVSESYDKGDLEALKKMSTLRSQWSKDEDEILLLCYAASRYYIPRGISSYYPAHVYRKLLHEKSEVSASKTSMSCVRRIKNMMKNPFRRHSSDLFVKDLLRDEELKTKVQTIIDDINASIGSKDSSNCLPHMHKLTEQVFYYLYDNSQVKINLSNAGKIEIELPDTLEEFRNQYDVEYPVENTRKANYVSLKSENDVAITVLTALIYSTLFSQVDRTKSINMNYLYQVLKYFDDNHLNLALSFVRTNKLISLNKYSDRFKNSLMLMGKGTYHFSVTFHTILKSLCNLKLFASVYKTYLDYLKNPTLCFENDTSDIGMNLVQIVFMIHEKIEFNISVPENIMFFSSSPIPEVDPETIKKPMLDSIENHTKKTLSLIQDTFFKNAENAKEGSLSIIQDTVFESDEVPDDLNISKSTISDDKKDSDRLSDNDSDDELNIGLDEELERLHGKRSKISVILTRKTFKQSYTRFSNAYDHFLINKFSVSSKLESNRCLDTLTEGTKKEFSEKIEKNSTYTKIEYKSSELTDCVKKILDDAHERDYALHFLNYLQSIGVTGATCEMITSEFKDLRLLKKITDELLKKKLILRGGSQLTRYIHIDYAKQWLMPCWKNLDAFTNENSSNADPALPVVANRIINEKFESTNEKNQVWIVIRPWIQINGGINKSALDSLLVRIVTYLAKNPGISLYNLQRKFEPALLPHWTRELLEILLDVEVVQWNVFEVPEFSLSSKSAYGRVLDEVSGFENEKSILIEPDVNCLAKLSMFIANNNYEDLLDTKYVVGENAKDVK